MAELSTPGAAAEKTLSVVIHKAGSFTERFVERHIRESFGGATVVLARRAGDAHTFTQPMLVADPRALGWRARVSQWIGAPLALLRYGYAGVPGGMLGARIRGFWRQHRVMAVLAEFGPLGCWIAPVARAQGVPVFVYFRGYDASSKLRSARSVRAYRRMMEQVDGVFAVSAFLVDNLRRAGVEHPNTHVIPSGTNPRLFRPAVKDPNLIVSVGRFVDKKRPDATVRAFAAAAARWPALRLEMVGQGPQLEACRQLANTLGVASRVHFLGPRDHRFVAELLSRAQVYLQHSVTAPGGETEGLPSSIQEAMAAGAVVVATRHAGIAEIVVEGRTGWLVDEHDEAGYAAALLRTLEDPAQAATMARNARLLAEERLDTHLLQQRMEAVILQAVRARTGGAA
jgi:colanic acid/amylovoran biosynthesis glycosyltransferase